MSLSLLNPPPVAVEIDGIQYAINPDFRTGIRIDLILKSKEPDAEILEKAIRLFYHKIPDDIPAAVEKILWFFRCGKAGVPEAEKSEKHSEFAYDFEQDGGYLYAAFLQQYGIDLLQTETMHWWVFRALFDALNDDCEFVRIMQFRTIKITGNMSKEQKAYYNRMKRLFSLTRQSSGKADYEKYKQGMIDYVNRRYAEIDAKNQR